MEPDLNSEKPDRDFYKPDEDFYSRQIRELRAEKGMSQRQLAELAKVHRKTLRRIEDGTSPIDIYIYDRLLKALGHEMALYPKEGNRIVRSK